MSRSSSLAPAVLALVGTLVGYGIASASHGADDPRQLSTTLSPGPREAPADPNLAALLEEVRALGDRIAALAATDDQRTPVDSSGAPGTERLVDLLERCTTLIERLESTGSRDFSSRLRMPTDSPKLKSFEAIPWDEPGAQQALTSELMLSSRQQILDRFGKPSFIYDNDGELWHYERTDRGAKARGLSLRFIDGHVMSANW
jgi:hypothetical protein